MYTEILKKVKINYISEKYWYFPPIFTMSRSKWASRPFNTLDNLYKHFNMTKNPYSISFNRDPRFIHFNRVQAILKTGININSSEVQNTTIFEFNILNKKAKIIIDQMSIKYLQKGLEFSCPLDYFQDIVEESKLNDNEVLAFYWRKRYFALEKQNININESEINK